MTDSVSLSIGIPTYFRSADVRRLVDGLRAADSALPVTVIDDGPDPETAKALAELGQPVRLIRHEQNRGYAHSFLELFDTCETEYLLVSADDDLCDPEGLSHVRAALKGAAPDFAATQFFDRAGAMVRGRDTAGPIALADIRNASGHAPGLIYRLSAMRPALPFLRARLEAGCYAARIYPQTVLVYLIALQGADCRWMPAAPIREGAARDAQLSDTDGTTYNSPVGRLREHLAFSEVFAAMSETLPDTAQARLAAIATLHEQDFYRRFVRALRLHHPDLIEDWMAGSLFYARRSLPRHLLNTLIWWRRRQRAEQVLRKAN